MVSFSFARYVQLASRAQGMAQVVDKQGIASAVLQLWLSPLPCPHPLLCPAPQGYWGVRPPVDRRAQLWILKAAGRAALVSSARRSPAGPDATFPSEICFYLLGANPGLSALPPDGCKCKCALI